MAYATKVDVYLALAAPAFVAMPRPFDAVDPVSGLVKLKAHGLLAIDLLTIDLTDGGRPPTGVSQFARYRAAPLSADLFRLVDAETSAVFSSFADVGAGWAVAVDPEPRIEYYLTERASVIDEHLTAHDPPIQAPYPPVLVGLNARMAARMAVPTLAFQNPAYREPIDRLMASEAMDNKLLDWWLGGKPLNTRPADADGAVPENAMRATSSKRAIPWTKNYF